MQRALGVVGSGAVVRVTTVCHFERFSAVGNVLCDALPVFSMDLVSVCASYLVCGTAKAGAQPRVMFSFGFIELKFQPFPGGCQSVMCSPNHRIWVCSNAGLRVFDETGVFLFRAAPHIESPNSVAFDGTRAFFIDFNNDKIASCSLDGAVSPDCASVTMNDDLWSLAVGNDEVFVSSSSACHICVLARHDLTVVRAFGAEGSGDGQFHCPRGIVISSDLKEILVADEKNNRVQVRDRVILCT